MAKCPRSRRAQPTRFSGYEHGQPYPFDVSVLVIHRGEPESNDPLHLYRGRVIGQVPAPFPYLTARDSREVNEQGRRYAAYLPALVLPLLAKMPETAGMRIEPGSNWLFTRITDNRRGGSMVPGWEGEYLLHKGPGEYTHVLHVTVHPPMHFASKDGRGEVLTIPGLMDRGGLVVKRTFSNRRTARGDSTYKSTSEHLVKAKTLRSDGARVGIDQNIERGLAGPGYAGERYFTFDAPVRAWFKPLGVVHERGVEVEPMLTVSERGWLEFTFAFTGREEGTVKGGSTGAVWRQQLLRGEQLTYAYSLSQYGQWTRWVEDGKLDVSPADRKRLSVWLDTLEAKGLAGFSAPRADDDAAHDRDMDVAYGARSAGERYEPSISPELHERLELERQREREEQQEEERPKSMTTSSVKAMENLLVENTGTSLLYRLANIPLSTKQAEYLWARFPMVVRDGLVKYSKNALEMQGTDAFVRYQRVGEVTPRRNPSRVFKDQHGREYESLVDPRKLTGLGAEDYLVEGGDEDEEELSLKHPAQGHARDFKRDRTKGANPPFFYVTNEDPKQKRRRVLSYPQVLVDDDGMQYRLNVADVETGIVKYEPMVAAKTALVRKKPAPAPVVAPPAVVTAPVPVPAVAERVPSVTLPPTVLAPPVAAPTKPTRARGNGWWDEAHKVGKAELQRYAVAQNEGKATVERFFNIPGLTRFKTEAEREAHALEAVAYLMPQSFEESGLVFVRSEARKVDVRGTPTLLVSYVAKKPVIVDGPHQVPVVDDASRASNAEAIAAARANDLYRVRPELSTPWGQGTASEFTFQPAGLARGGVKFIRGAWQPVFSELQLRHFPKKGVVQLVGRLDGNYVTGSMRVSDLRANPAQVPVTLKRARSADMQGHISFVFNAATGLNAWMAKLANEGLGKLNDWTNWFGDRTMAEQGVRDAEDFIESVKDSHPPAEVRARLSKAMETLWYNDFHAASSKRISKAEFDEWSRAFKDRLAVERSRTNWRLSGLDKLQGPGTAALIAASIPAGVPFVPLGRLGAFPSEILQGKNDGFLTLPVRVTFSSIQGPRGTPRDSWVMPNFLRRPNPPERRGDVIFQLGGDMLEGRLTLREERIGNELLQRENFNVSSDVSTEFVPGLQNGSSFPVSGHWSSHSGLPYYEMRLWPDDVPALRVVLDRLMERGDLR